MDYYRAASKLTERNVSLETILSWAKEGKVSTRDMVRADDDISLKPVTDLPEVARILRESRPTSRPSASEAAAEATDEADDDDYGGGAAWVPKRIKSRLDDVGLDMTPMIDVTFQLLIFFMFTNQLANPNPLEVPQARHGKGVSPEGKQMILIDAEGSYYLGDVVAPDALVESIGKLVKEVELNAADHDTRLDVIVTAHKDAKHKHIRQLAEQIGQIPNIGELVLGVEEKP